MSQEHLPSQAPLAAVGPVKNHYDDPAWLDAAELLLAAWDALFNTPFCSRPHCQECERTLTYLIMGGI